MITSIHTFDHISQYIHEKDHTSSYLFYTINTCSWYWHLDLVTIMVDSNRVQEVLTVVAMLDPLAADFMKPKT